jgi:hypothetical protein
MATVNFYKVSPEYEELARKVTAENKATMTETGGLFWTIKASPRLVIRRSTFDEVFGGKPVWDCDAWWRSLVLSREGLVTKQADDEIVIEDA